MRIMIRQHVIENWTKEKYLKELQHVGKMPLTWWRAYLLAEMLVLLNVMFVVQSLISLSSLCPPNWLR